MNDIYLNLDIRKSINEKTDENGNYIFEVEASNENVDLQDQVVLQNALIESKDDFLKNGVISYDHLHKRKADDGSMISDPSMIIGEPIDVKFDPETKTTVVVGKLYKNNDKAKELIKMLQAGSTRVRASVGGIFPKIVKDVKTGIEKVAHVFWNDLALTTSPVNSTVGSACFAKSMTSSEFVKALTCGNYETDSTEKTNGEALIKEACSEKSVNATEENSNIDNEKDLIEYVKGFGLTEEKAREILDLAKNIYKGDEQMAKSFKKVMSELFKKSVDVKDDDEKLKDKVEDEDIDQNTLDLEDDVKDENKDDKAEEVEKSEGAEDSDNTDDTEDSDKDDEDGDLVDGKEVLEALDGEITDIHTEIQSLTDSIKALTDNMANLSKKVDQISNVKLPNKSVMNKGTDKETDEGDGAKPTEEDFKDVQEVLTKSVKSGELTLAKSSAISSDFQRCMKTGTPMKKEYFNFLAKKIKESK